MKKPRYKIGFVLDDSLDRTDGVQQYVMTLGEWFRTQGHEVHYLVGHTTRSDLANIHSLSRTLRVRANQNRLGTPLPASKRKIRDLLQREQFDVLHIQMPYSPALAGKVIAQAPAKTAVIGTFHIFPFSRLESAGARALGLVLRHSLKRFDHIVAVSKPAADFAQKTFHVKAEVLPNAVNLDAFRFAKKIQKHKDGTLTIVYLGRLVARKGCLHLLEALAQLRREKQLHDTHIIVAGMGPMERQLKQFVQRNDLTGLVEFVGFVSEKEKPSYLAAADIAVVPSTGGESFGIVLVEAMAAGADVIVAGDNPGYRFVLNGSEEQLVDPRDTAAFVRVLKYFMQDSEARARTKARQAKLMQAYDVRQVGGRLLEIYQRTLRNKQGMR